MFMHNKDVGLWQRSSHYVKSEKSSNCW